MCLKERQNWEVKRFLTIKRALAQDKDLMNVISKIGILMADKGFPLKDLSASIKIWK